MKKEEKKYPWLKNVHAAAARYGWEFSVDFDEEPACAGFSITLPSGREVVADFYLEDVPREQMLPEFLKGAEESFAETALRLRDIVVAKEGPGSEEICQPEADGLYGEDIEKEKEIAEADSIWFAEKAGRLYEKLSGLLRKSAVMARGIREMSGMTREVFGETYGISVNTIRNWEAGRRPCPAYVSALLERAVRDDLAQKEALEYSYSEGTLQELGYCFHGLLEAAGKLRADSCACACEYPALHFLDAFTGATGIMLPDCLLKRALELVRDCRMKQLADAAEVPLEEGKWKFFKQGFQEYAEEIPVAENVQIESGEEEGWLAETVAQDD